MKNKEYTRRSEEKIEHVNYSPTHRKRHSCMGVCVCETDCKWIKVSIFTSPGHAIEYTSISNELRNAKRSSNFQPDEIRSTSSNFLRTQSQPKNKRPCNLRARGLGRSWVVWEKFNLHLLLVLYHNRRLMWVQWECSESAEGVRTEAGTKLMGEFIHSPKWYFSWEFKFFFFFFECDR